MHFFKQTLRTPFDLLRPSFTCLPLFLSAAILCISPLGCSSSSTSPIASPIAPPAAPPITPLPQNLIANGTYIISSNSNGQVVDVYGNSTVQGGLIDHVRANGGNNQKWILTNLGNNYVELVNVRSNMALDLSNDPLLTGTQNIDQSPYSGGNNQKWQIVSQGGAYELVNQASGDALDLPSSTNYLDQSPVAGTANQLWNFASTTASSMPSIGPLVDAQATPATVALFNYIQWASGNKIISGQTDDDASFSAIFQASGAYPLIRDYDMQPYSPEYSYSWDSNAINPTTGALGYFAFGPNSSNPNTPNAIAWYNSNNKKPIIDFQWHWHSPSGGTVGTNTFDAYYTTFDVSQAVISGTPENIATLRDIDAIAVQLQKINAAGIPMIWRPLHEAAGGGFWWDAKGPAAYIALWNLMYDRLVNYHGLHNLIWTWTGDDPAWYPGRDRVDILGIDSYPGNFNYETNQPEYARIAAIAAGTKVLAMTENGPIPDINSCLTGGAPYAFFVSWYSVTIGNDTNHLNSVYTNPNTVTLQNR